MMDLYYTKEVIDTVASNRIFQEEMRKNVEEHLAIVEEISENASLEQYLENYMYDYKFHESISEMYRQPEDPGCLQEHQSFRIFQLCVPQAVPGEGCGRGDGAPSRCWMLSVKRMDRRSRVRSP